MTSRIKLSRRGIVRKTNLCAQSSWRFYCKGGQVTLKVSLLHIIIISYIITVDLRHVSHNQRINFLLISRKRSFWSSEGDELVIRQLF